MCWLILLFFRSLAAQPIVDTTITWQAYAKTGATHIQIYNNPANADRYKTIIIKELANNTGPTATSDLAYLAQEISRTFDFNPTKAYWVLHWGAFSFEGAQKDKKELFIRVSFKFARNLQLGSPQWRVIERAEVEEMTDRLFQ